jgi:hypothetical protein
MVHTVIPVKREAVGRKIMIQASLGKNIRHCLKNNQSEKGLEAGVWFKC